MYNIMHLSINQSINQSINKSSSWHQWQRPWQVAAAQEEDGWQTERAELLERLQHLQSRQGNMGLAVATGRHVTSFYLVLPRFAVFCAILCQQDTNRSCVLLPFFPSFFAFDTDIRCKTVGYWRCPPPCLTPPLSFGADISLKAIQPSMMYMMWVGLVNEWNGVRVQMVGRLDDG